MQLVGLTRFSVVTESGLAGFRATRHLNFDQACRVCLSDERLEHRFRFFEAFALPTIRVLMQHNDRYSHFICISDHLPAKYARRLRALVNDLPRTHLLKAGHRDSCSNIFRDAVAELHQGRTFTFRLDDDDALAVDYFDIVGEAIRGVSRDVGVSLDRGYALEPTEPGYYRLKRQTKPLVACGLGLLSSTPRTIFDLGGHTQIDRHVEVRHHNKRGWIVLAHQHCDTNRRVKKPLTWSASFVRAWLGPRFAHIRLHPEHGGAKIPIEEGPTLG